MILLSMNGDRCDSTNVDESYIYCRNTERTPRRCDFFFLSLSFFSSSFSFCVLAFVHVVVVVHEILSCCVDFDMNWVSYLDAAPKSIDSAMHESARFPRRELPSLKCHRAVFVTRGC